MMKKNLMILLLCLTAVQCSFSQQLPQWNAWSWLIGEWVGEGSGKPGEGTGSFSLLPDLDGKILIRKAHSEYPQTEKKPATIHDDLMIIYPNAGDNSTTAIYLDNEGHVINYVAFCAESSIVLKSAETSSAPIFKLTYTLIDPQTINVTFALSRDGEQFMTYVEGKCKRVMKK